MRYTVLFLILALVGCGPSPGSHVFTCKTHTVKPVEKDGKVTWYEHKIVTDSDTEIMFTVWCGDIEHCMLSKIEAGGRYRISYRTTGANSSCRFSSIEYVPESKE